MHDETKHRRKTNEDCFTAKLKVIGDGFIVYSNVVRHLYYAVNRGVKLLEEHFQSCPSYFERVLKTEQHSCHCFNYPVSILMSDILHLSRS